MMWDMHDGAGWWMLYGGIMMVVFWGLIIWLAIWLISKITSHEQSGRGSERRDPLDIAKERYARGEISKEEFDKIKKDLS
jgi:putative membrane protein